MKKTEDINGDPDTKASSLQTNTAGRVMANRCDICGALYVRRGSLIWHQATAHGGVAFLNSTSHYDNTANNEKLPKLHDEITAVVMAYQCDICGAGFTERNGLAWHKATEHGGAAFL